MTPSDEVERLQRENGALARMYAVCEETLRERTAQLTVTHQALRDALKEQRRLQTADRQWADHVSGLVAERDRLNKLLEAERRVARAIGDAHKKDAAEVQRLVAVLDEIERGARSLDYATHLARVAVVPPTDEGLEQSQGLMPSA